MKAPVLIPLDGSEQALVALPVARRLAELEASTLHLVHVARETFPPEEILRRVGLGADELRGSVLASKAGEPAAGIIEAAREINAALIVMCTHSAVAPAEETMGSTALAVVKASPCPVVLVRPARGVEPWALRRILLPHDGTPMTSAAIRPAADLARKSAAELHVLHVAAPGGRLPAESGTLTSPRYVDQPQHEWPAWIQEFVERLGSIVPLEFLKVRMSLAPGVTSEQVLRFAREHETDLTVLAWKGEWEGEHAATLKAILGHTTSPVMIIRTAA